MSRTFDDAYLRAIIRKIAETTGETSTARLAELTHNEMMGRESEGDVFAGFKRLQAELTGYRVAAQRVMKEKVFLVEASNKSVSLPMRGGIRRLLPDGELSESYEQPSIFEMAPVEFRSYLQQRESALQHDMNEVAALRVIATILDRFPLAETVGEAIDSANLNYEHIVVSEAM